MTSSDRERSADVEGTEGEGHLLVGRRLDDAAQALRRISTVRQSVRAFGRFEVRARTQVPTDRVQCHVVAAGAARLVGAAARLIDDRPQTRTCREDLRRRPHVGTRTREFAPQDRIRAPLARGEVGFGERRRRLHDRPLAAQRLSGAGNAAYGDEHSGRQADEISSASRVNRVIISSSD